MVKIEYSNIPPNIFCFVPLPSLAFSFSGCSTLQACACKISKPIKWVQTLCGKRLWLYKILCAAVTFPSLHFPSFFVWLVRLHWMIERSQAFTHYAACMYMVTAAYTRAHIPVISWRQYSGIDTIKMRWQPCFANDFGGEPLNTHIYIFWKGFQLNEGSEKNWTKHLKIGILCNSGIHATSVTTKKRKSTKKLAKSDGILFVHIFRLFRVLSFWWKMNFDRTRRISFEIFPAQAEEIITNSVLVLNNLPKLI